MFAQVIARRCIRRVNKRGMGQDHGVIYEHWVLFIFLHKLNDKITKNIRPKRTGIGFTTIFCKDIRVPKPFCTRFYTGLVSSPHTEFVETRFGQSIWFYPKIINLPFARNASFITGPSNFLNQGRIHCFVEMCTSAPTGNIPMVNPAMPKGILFWRSMTHWIGGMGIIVFTVAILPILGIGGMQLYSAEMPGVTKDKLHPRITETAKRLWAIYMILTLAETIFLLIGGLSLFDALCHTFGTVATGGFSTHNASTAGFSAYNQYVIIVFMILAGTNFTLHYFALHGQLRKVWRNEEFRYFIYLILAGTLIITLVLAISKDGMSIEEAFRTSFFQVTSIITTTGYITDNYMLWPGMVWFLIVLMMFVGGMAGSTGGGIKVVRQLLLLKNSLLELKRDAFEMLRALEVLDPVRRGEAEWDGTVTVLAGNEELLVRNAALETLAERAGDANVDLLVERLSHEDWATRMTVVQSLDKLRAKSAVPFLIEMLDEEPHLRLRDEVIEVLLSLTGQTFGGNTRSWRAWWDDNHEAKAGVTLSAERH